VHENGIDRVRDLVEARFAEIAPGFDAARTAAEHARIAAHFAPPALADVSDAPYHAARTADPVFRSWSDSNVTGHKTPGYGIVTVSLKAHGAVPGDATGAQMCAVADLAERYGHGEIRVSHEQNLILPHVALAHLQVVHAELMRHGLATANAGLLSDIIACPGMDYCALATARSIPVAQELATHFEALKLEHDIGPLKIKISGCINACGHHHVGHIGILGLDRAGVETYQITLGGDGSQDAALGERTGPGFAYDEIVPAIERILRAYLALRHGRGETFLQVYRRLGPAPFKAALYDGDQADAA
jgi:sulfite reductase (NADPH) hemoprotein beta-component